jgi:hypothetical protein
LVEVIFFLSRVGKSDVVEGDDGRRQLLYVFEVEAEGAISSNFGSMKIERSYRKGLGVSTFSIKPAASILSMIFCFDFAWRTRLAYVPADAINLGFGS